jgi:hypothetical protein
MLQTLNGAEGTVSPGRVYKKVAIVENFFDIIHAVHVDLEGRPGKHAGQKRTYRTVSPFQIKQHYYYFALLYLENHSYFKVC